MPNHPSKQPALSVGPYAQWEAGELRSDEAIPLLVKQLANLQDRLEPLQHTEKAIRAQLSVMVDNVGGKFEVPGYGKLNITSAGTTVTYDRKELDKFTAALEHEILELTLSGHESEEYERTRIDALVAVVGKLKSCRKESSRSGGLRILKDSEAD